ncbi:hypothetical protein CORC01_14242 [Colletotrichum orchidophilum]|uniref:Uncharacterized protein n=1 Tax=Colletotrichum orchidophilum TaxID=1209926 RepID=A0A1G4AMQ5_9PEZI|nr:uncharacterized protein CORC01_14242 [Colletotrichum orchidophilum]OHE90459.1 hypothetical protein CORC01_14242 [Colletotrichum orchidophilum]
MQLFCSVPPSCWVSHPTSCATDSRVHLFRLTT